jgi:serine/threonine protein kinase
VREKIALEAGKGGLPRSKIVNGFEMGITLGKGKFGEVFRSRHHDVGFVVALKKVMKSKVA